MDYSPIISWARSTSYDVVAIFLPGVVSLLLIVLMALFLPEVRDLIVSAKVSEANVFADITATSRYLLFIVAAYLFGFILKAMGGIITKSEDCNKWYWKQNYFYGNKLQRLDYSAHNSALYKLAVRQLNSYLVSVDISEAGLSEEDTNWPLFYRLSQAVLESKQIPSKTVTYQNRYELFKSLSVGLGIVSILSLFVFLFYIESLVCEEYTISIEFFSPLVIAIVFFFLSILARDLYLKYWQNLGDTLIVSILVTLGTKD